MGRREGDTERKTHIYRYTQKERKTKTERERETESEREPESDREESQKWTWERPCFSWSKRPPEVRLVSFKRKLRGIC